MLSRLALLPLFSALLLLAACAPDDKTFPDFTADPLAGFEVEGREVLSLDGDWSAAEDPMGVFLTRRIWRGDGPPVREPKEYDWASMETLPVPGDWNLARPTLFRYEGLVWYGRNFQAPPLEGKRAFIFFEGVNYTADVFLNGERLGRRDTGYLPFRFEVTELLQKDNFLVAAVNNRRESFAVPSLDFDWFNYGGIYRSVGLITVPETFIRDYRFVASNSDGRWTAAVKIALDGPGRPEVKISFPELGTVASGQPDSNGRLAVNLAVKPEPWTPDNPSLYDIVIETEDDKLTDRVGFRTLTIDNDNNLLLNGRPTFLKGVCLHEETPKRGGRSLTEADVRWLFRQIKDLNGNFARLAHYPHSRHAARVADEMGILLWEEIPVYWSIEFHNPQTLGLAREMFHGLYLRDKNRASVALWSIGNETGGEGNKPRKIFFKAMVDLARSLDRSRWITSANNTSRLKDNVASLADPTAEFLDVYGINEYYGWYSYNRPEERGKINGIDWNFPYAKPVIMSEFGAGALYGKRGGPHDFWTEDFQAYTYEQQLAMLDKLDFVKGLAPWLLVDFRSPRRLHPRWQKGYNRKGIIDEQGRRKLAFQVLADYYAGK